MTGSAKRAMSLSVYFQKIKTTLIVITTSQALTRARRRRVIRKVKITETVIHSYKIQASIKVKALEFLRGQIILTIKVIYLFLMVKALT